jgi:hypothetical protein
MMSCVIADALMPRPVTAAAGTPLVIGYAVAIHQLALRKLAANHSIGTIIDKDTGTILEYPHLVKNPAKNCVGNKLSKQKRVPIPRDMRAEGHKHVFLHQEISSPHQQIAHVRPNML